MWGVEPSPDQSVYAAAAAAQGKQVPPGAFASVDAPSPYSSWRYAPARESTDSEGAPTRHSPGSGVTAEVTWRAAGAALAARNAAGHPQGQCQPPAADTSPAAAAELRHGSDQRQLSPSKRPAASAGSNGAGAVVLHSAVPPGMDAASYAAGERAALMSAFQQALPSQQALGQLFTAVDALHARLEDEAQQWRHLHGCSAATAAQLEAVAGRLDGVERQQLPALQAKWEEVAGRVAPEQLVKALGGLQHALSLLAQQRDQRPAGGGCGPAAGSAVASGFVGRRLHWLLLAAAGYGQSLLSKADVAALLLSRRILLLPADADAAAEQQPRLRRLLSSALGALLLVVAVEAAYQGQLRAAARMPTLVRHATAPAQLGLRAARTAVWCAALVLGAEQARGVCHAASDNVCGAVAAAAGAVQLPAWVWVLPPLRRWQQWRQQQLEVAAAANDKGVQHGSGAAC